MFRQRWRQREACERIGGSAVREEAIALGALLLLFVFALGRDPQLLVFQRDVTSSFLKPGSSAST